MEKLCLAYLLIAICAKIFLTINLYLYGLQKFSHQSFPMYGSTVLPI